MPFDPSRFDILVVDDNANNLGVLSDMLGQKGYPVRVATNGRRGLEVASSCHPDLIMLDISMPEMDGFEMCALLKKNPATAEIPIIFISARDEDEVKVKAFELGGADYVQKPFQVPEVMARVQHHLRLAEFQRELEAQNAHMEEANLRLNELLLQVGRANEQLEDKVAERTAEIQEQIRALRLSEERNRILIESSPEGILVYDADQLQVTEANSMAARYLGLDRDQIIGRNLLDLLPENPFEDLGTSEEVKGRISRALTGEVVQSERQIRRSDGALLDLEVHTVRLPFQGRNLLLATALDITARRRQERELEAYRNNLESTLDAIPDLLFEVGLDGRYHSFHSGRADLLAAPVDQLIGRTVKEVLHAEAAATVLAALREAQETGRSSGGRIQLDLPQGRAWFELSVARKAGAPGTDPRFLVLSRDITDRVEAEAERRHLEEQLFQSQKMESLGLLAGGIAHDINNMLGAIMGHIEMLKFKVADTPGVDRHVEGILAAADRSKDIVQKVLAFSRRQVFTPRSVELNVHIESTQKTISPLIGEDIKLSFWPCKELSQVLADPSQLDQILMNLVLNARDAMPRGGSIVLETMNRHVDAAFCLEHPQASPGDYVVLSVQDSGTGMDPLTLTRIFEPFFTTKEVGVGTGLGLSTVLGIVKQNGGFMTVASHLGQGSTLQVFLPRLGEAVQVVADSRVEVPSPRTGGTILLVEDDPLLRNIMSSVVQKLGYEALTADSAEEALEIAAQPEIRIDILLTDVIMPEMNGKELKDHFDLLRPGVPTLFMSGYTADVIAKRGIPETGVHLIRKPFSLDELAEKLHGLGLDPDRSDPNLPGP